MLEEIQQKLSKIFKLQPLFSLNCNIYRKDIQTIRPHRQLNSEAIHYLMQMISATKSKEKIKIIDPFVTNMLIHMGNQQIILQTMRQQHLFTYSLLFLPSNTETKQSGPGSHWFLMVYDVQENILYTFDSTYECIHQNAKTMAKRLGDMRKMFMPEKKAHKQVQIIRCENAVKQDNSYDCGVYTVGFYQQIIEKWTQTQQQQQPHKLCLRSIKFNQNRFLGLRASYFQQALKQLQQTTMEKQINT